MGIYLNPGNMDFTESLNAKIYIDKSMLIEQTNSILHTSMKYVCVSRPRRFGKSITANMLSAYYGCGCDSRELFSNLKISKSDSFEKHLNKYNVIHINMQDFLSRNQDINEMISYLSRRILHEIKGIYSMVDCFDWEDLVSVLAEVFAYDKKSFVFVIDEWDCIFRVHKNNLDAQKKYLDFLRNLLKDKSYVALAYMTGILPIKKYGEHSALNMFTEISMTNARNFAEFTGFTEDEVKALCKTYDMNFAEVKRWYDGYNVNGYSIYNPRSVVLSMTGHNFDNYWTQTETYEALKIYIQMNFDGLRDTITQLIAGGRKKIDTTTFVNDMVTFAIQDDVLTLLIHLGYLSFDFDTKEVFIPNFEVSEQFISSVRILGWDGLINSIRTSDELLNATINGDTETVTQLVEKSHTENTSIIKYNDENSLACVIRLAYYSARKYYNIFSEQPAGKGFADLVFVPKKANSDKPAMIVELKWNKSADTAIKQINDKNYSDCLTDYRGEILLVGINYDKDTKEHSCVIEKIAK